MYFWESDFVFLRDCGTFTKRVKFQKKLFLTRASKINQHRIPLGSAIIQNSEFYRDFSTFEKKVKFSKKFHFLTRECKIRQHWIPIRSPIMHKFCVYKDFGTF